MKFKEFCKKGMEDTQSCHRCIEGIENCLSEYKEKAIEDYLKQQEKNSMARSLPVGKEL